MDVAQDDLDIFADPEGYYQSPPAHTFRSYTLQNGHKLQLRLVGQSPLWGHHLWQAALIIARFLEEQSDLYLQGKTVLELGAGAGLPSLVAGLCRARQVVVTDYPDNNLIENLEYNIRHCSEASEEGNLPNIIAKGFMWGADPSCLLALLSQPHTGTHYGFDTLILADLLFNHTCHESLLKTVTQTLARRRDAVALVFFSPYRPWLLDKDLAFFDLVRQDRRLIVDELGKWMMDQVMFEDDRGDETLRRTVLGYKLRWADV
ncbi:MAG: hypothetical protein Q9162_005431 [Coniocarpon cinnabarinum]